MLKCFYFWCCNSLIYLHILVPQCTKYLFTILEICIQNFILQKNDLLYLTGLKYSFHNSSALDIALGSGKKASGNLSLLFDLESSKSAYQIAVQRKCVSQECKINHLKMFEKKKSQHDKGK